MLLLCSFQIISNLVYMYADNMLCIDLCGMSASIAMETIGPEVGQLLDIPSPQRSKRIDFVLNCVYTVLRKAAGTICLTWSPWQLVNHVQRVNKSEKIGGCRHVCQGIQSCTHYINRKAKYLADKFEPVVEEVRILPADGQKIPRL